MNHPQPPIQPPQLFDLEAEQAVLGSIIYRNDLLKEINLLLTPASFHAPAHQGIFQAMLELAKEEQPIDEVLLGDRLKAKGNLESCGGYAYLAELVDCVPASGNAAHYAGIVARYAQKRSIRGVVRDQLRRMDQGLIDPTTFLADLNRQAEGIVIAQGHAQSKSLKDLQVEMWPRLEKITKAGVPQGLMTCLPDLDEVLLGLDPGKLYVIAARPSMGKTALAGCLALAFSLRSAQPVPGLFISLEMSKDEMSDRFHGQMAKINSNSFRNGVFRAEDWDNLALAAEQLGQAPIYVDDRAYSIADIRSEAWFLDAELRQNGGQVLGYLIVDYLQLVKGTMPGQIREQEIAEISRSLKQLAKEMQIPVIALSQLNRSLEARKDKHPVLSDLRESGAIEQDADVVMFVYRDEVYDAESENKGLAELDIAKHRGGATGRVWLKYDGPTYRFLSLSNLQNQQSNAGAPW